MSGERSRILHRPLSLNAGGMVSNFAAQPAPFSSASCCFHYARQVGLKVTKQIRRRACHLGSCPTCGAAAAIAWVNQHLLKGRTIGDRWVALVISFPKIELPSGANKKLKAQCLKKSKRQREMVEKIKLAAMKSTFGHLVGYAGVCHFHSLSRSEVRYHLHFGFYPGRTGESEALEKIRAFCEKNGLMIKKDQRRNSQLLGWLKYLRHRPIQSTAENSESGFTEKQRKWIEDAIFIPWRNWRSIDKQAFPSSVTARFMGGPTISPQGFIWVRARARTAAFMKGKPRLRERLRFLSDPDSKFEHYQDADLQKVTYWVKCPKCRHQQRVVVVQKEKKNVCEKCEHQWPDRAALAGIVEGAKKRRRPPYVS